MNFISFTNETISYFGGDIATNVFSICLVFIGVPNETRQPALNGIGVQPGQPHEILLMSMTSWQMKTNPTRFQIYIQLLITSSAKLQ